MKNIWEKVKDITSPYAADDDYDDEYDDDLDDGFAEEEPASRFSSRDSRRERRAPAVSEEPLFPAAPEESTDALSAGFSSGSSISTGFNGHVVGSGLSSSKQQMVVLRPKSFKDASTFAYNLREKKAIVLNLENVDKALSVRVVDFLSGCAFAVDGTVKKVANAIYVFCPNNMEITGDLNTLNGESEVYV